MNKEEKKHLKIGDTVSLNHTYDLIMSYKNSFDTNKNCCIYEVTKDYYFLYKIEKENKIHFLKTKKHLKNNISHCRNLLIEKNNLNFKKI